MMETYTQIIFLVVHVSGCAMFYFIGCMVGGNKVFYIFNNRFKDLDKE